MTPKVGLWEAGWLLPWSLGMLMVFRHSLLGLCPHAGRSLHALEKPSRTVPAKAVSTACRGREKGLLALPRGRLPLAAAPATV